MKWSEYIKEILERAEKMKPFKRYASFTCGEICGDHFVGWMKSKMPGEDDFHMYINEQPNGGFKWEFLDYKPKDEENYQKIYITHISPTDSTDIPRMAKRILELEGAVADLLESYDLTQHPKQSEIFRSVTSGLFMNAEIAREVLNREVDDD